MARLVTSKEEREAIQKANVIVSVGTDFTRLMDAAWIQPELKFLTELSYDESKKWYEHMLETWKKDVLPTLSNEDADDTPIEQKAISVKKFRKDKKNSALERKRIAGKV